MATYKTIDLFGNESLNFIDKKKNTPKTLFSDYDGFVDKFEDKKTTDDCYTPSDVYQAVLDFVSSKHPLQGVEIVRPFYPGGDYESIDYPSGCVVIDNPPFSIISKICRFYIKNNIKFFLFAPHLTLFGSNIECTAVVAGCDIIYENGAAVKTSFLSNLFQGIKVIAAHELYKASKAINEKNKANLPKYSYPLNILTVSHVQKFVEMGIDFELKQNESVHCRGLDSQKMHKKAIFGSGFLLSEKAAAEKAAAEKDNIIIWEISDREKKIIQSMAK